MKKNNNSRTVISLSIASLFAVAAPTVMAESSEHSRSPSHSVCSALPNQATLKSALQTAVSKINGGFNLDMWATLVARDGTVCAVAYSGASYGAQWPGSRVISAQKANTANAFSLDKLALSTANLYSAVQPGGSLFGLQASNPVDTDVAYGGNSAQFGTSGDYMVGKKIGGVNVFGGGLGLYDTHHKIIGGVGVSGDSSCADHNIAWRVRNTLGLDNFGSTVGGVNPDTSRPDNIIYDIAAAPLATTVNGAGNSASGWGHPQCSDLAASTASATGTLPAVQ